jgi:hypothetical protein
MKDSRPARPFRSCNRRLLEMEYPPPGTLVGLDLACTGEVPEGNPRHILCCPGTPMLPPAGLFPRRHINDRCLPQT